MTQFKAINEYKDLSAFNQVSKTNTLIIITSSILVSVLRKALGTTTVFL